MARAHVDIETRWGDQDAYGHVNNVAYARYIEESRVRVFFTGAAREKTGMEQLFTGNGSGERKFLVAGQQIEYLRVLNYSTSPVIIELWIGKIGGSSFEINYEVLDGAADERRVVARAKSNMVMVDGESLTPVRLSAVERMLLAPWQDEPLALRR